MFLFITEPNRIVVVFCVRTITSADRGEARGTIARCLDHGHGRHTSGASDDLTISLSVESPQLVHHYSARSSSLSERLGNFSRVFTAQCTLVQCAVLRSHVVCLSVCDVGDL